MFQHTSSEVTVISFTFKYTMQKYGITKDVSLSSDKLAIKSNKHKFLTAKVVVLRQALSPGTFILQ